MESDRALRDGFVFIYQAGRAGVALRQRDEGESHTSAPLAGSGKSKLPKVEGESACSASGAGFVQRGVAGEGAY